MRIEVSARWTDVLRSICGVWLLGLWTVSDLSAQPKTREAPLLSMRLDGERLSAPSSRTSIDPDPESSAAPAAGAAPAWNELTFDEVVAVGDEQRMRCTGVLVGPRHVLTARHCLPASVVLFGNDVLQPAGRRAVIEIHTPPELAIDAALLSLDKPVAVSVPLRRHQDDIGWPAGMLRPVGFGSTKRRLNLAYGRKRFIDLPTAGWGCDASRARDTGCRPDLEMFLLPVNGKDTCSGDSGGPVYERTRDRRRLLALTSRSADGARIECGAGGIYVRLDRFANWLDPLLER